MPSTPYAASALDTPIASAKRTKRRAQPRSSTVRRGGLYAEINANGSNKKDENIEADGGEGATSAGCEDASAGREEEEEDSAGLESPSPKARKSSPSSTPRNSGVDAGDSAERQKSGSNSKPASSEETRMAMVETGGASPSPGTTGGRRLSGGGDVSKREDINRHKPKESSLFSPALHPEHVEEERTAKAPASTVGAIEQVEKAPLDASSNKGKDRIEDGQGDAESATTGGHGDVSVETCAGEGGDGAEEEEEEDEEEEEEFNPYCFIAHLPPYNTVKHHTPEAPALPEKRKTRHGKELTLVLDLDETLVHCTVDPIVNPDHSFEVHFNGEEFQVYVRKRPHLDAFLEAVSELFEVVVFTASQRVYAERLLNMIDPQKKFVKYRLYRDACMALEGNYLKDLNVLGRDLSKVAIVDNSPYAYGFQIDNGIPIESWFDDTSDEELLHLLPLLKQLINQSEIAGGDVRPFIRSIFKTHELVDKARNGSLVDAKTVGSPAPPSAAEAVARAKTTALKPPASPIESST